MSAFFAGLADYEEQLPAAVRVRVYPQQLQSGLPWVAGCERARALQLELAKQRGAAGKVAGQVGERSSPTRPLPAAPQSASEDVASTPSEPQTRTSDWVLAHAEVCRRPKFTLVSVFQNVVIIARWPVRDSCKDRFGPTG